MCISIVESGFKKIQLTKTSLTFSNQTRGHNQKWWSLLQTFDEFMIQANDAFGSYGF